MNTLFNMKLQAIWDASSDRTAIFSLTTAHLFFIIISQRASSVDKKSTKSEHVCIVCPVYVYISFLVVFLHYTQDCFLLSPIHLVRAAICRTH